MFQTIKSYGENSSVHGVGYIFKPNQQKGERLFWIFVVLIGVALATFFSVEAYVAWKDVPLITSVSTTALPIESLAWPSVTLCSQGRGLGAVERIYNVQFKNYLKKKGKDVENLNDEEKQEEELKFLQENYPGLNESPTKIISAMTSSSPDSAVEANVLSGQTFEEEVQQTNLHPQQLHLPLQLQLQQQLQSQNCQPKHQQLHQHMQI